MYKNFKTKKDYIEHTLKAHGFTVVTCENDSAKHQGHTHYGEESHFTVTLKAKFSSVHERLQAHKKAISFFAEDIPAAIHALSFRFIS